MTASRRYVYQHWSFSAYVLAAVVVVAVLWFTAETITVQKDKAAHPELTAIEKLVRRGRWEESFRAIEAFSQRGEAASRSCFAVAKLLGTEAFDFVVHNKLIITPKTTSFCYYGFFVGFVEGIEREREKKKLVARFCTAIHKHLPSTPVNQCGFVLGVAFAVQKGVASLAATRCQEVARNSQFEVDCLQGVSTGIGLYAKMSPPLGR